MVKIASLAKAATAVAAAAPTTKKVKNAVAHRHHHVKRKRNRLMKGAYEAPFSSSAVFEGVVFFGWF
jgi:hypothetical protein